MKSISMKFMRNKNVILTEYQAHIQSLLSSVNRVTPLCAAKLQICTVILLLFASNRCNLENKKLNDLIAFHKSFIQIKKKSIPLNSHTTRIICARYE